MATIFHRVNIGRKIIRLILNSNIPKPPSLVSGFIPTKPQAWAIKSGDHEKPNPINPPQRKATNDPDRPTKRSMGKIKTGPIKAL